MTSQQTQTEQNKALVCQMFNDIWNKGQITAIDTFYAREMVAPMTEFVDAQCTAFAEWQLTIDDIVAESEQVAVHWHSSATHRGAYLGVPATGKRVAFEGMSLLRLVDGKIVDDQGIWDDHRVWQELSQDAS